MKISIGGKEKSNLVFGCIIIGAVSLFAWFFSYINEPIGDDVLCYYDGALTFYLDDFEEILGEKINNFPQIFKLLGFVYTHWSGRMPGYLINYVGKLLPKVIQALLTAIVFSANILLAMRIVYKKWTDTLSKPLIFGMLFLVLYWYRHGVYYIYMWTMVTIYSFGIMFCLLYYNLAVTDYENEKVHPLWMLLIIGFIAGFSHEVISFCTIVIVGTRWILNIINKKEKWNSIFRHFGFGIGYLFCFFAPGNFYRQIQSHDAISSTYLERLKVAWDVHMDVLKLNPTGGLILLITVILAYTSIVILIERHNKMSIMGAVYDVIPLFLGGGTSVLVWGYASYVAAYGLDFWIMIVYVILLRFIVEASLAQNFKKCKLVYALCTLAVMLVFAKSNAREVYHYSIISIERRTLAKEAAEKNIDEVEVPYFDSALSGDRYSISDLNDQNQYNREYYIGYYGTRLVLPAVE